MSKEQLSALPAVVDVRVAAQVLGLSRTAAYELIRLDQWPTPVYRLGRLIRIPTAPMLALLCVEQVPDAQEPRAAAGAVRTSP